jgi:cyclase
MTQPTRQAARLALAVCLAGWTLAAQSRAQDSSDEVIIERTTLTDHLAMLEGQGGNLGVCAGDEGIFLIDDQYAPLSEKILASIAEFSDQPLRFVLNTHWHGDHTGGNENMAARGAVIVAQSNVRRRMSTEQVSEIWDRTTPAASTAALPIVTFESEVTFHLNGQTIEVFHPPHAHTDGDAIVRFVEANVIHTGDVFFNGLYPFVDSDSGGSLTGVLSAVDMLLERSNAQTRFIPGHGPLADLQDLQNYRDMLATVSERIAEAKQKGMDLAAFLETNPTEEFDEKWGQAWLSGEKFMEIVYAGDAPQADHHGH